MKRISKKALLAKLKLLGDMDEDQKADVVCALIGHSRIQTTFFGYFYCARCKAQLGDNLGGYYGEAGSVVIVGHNCETCRKNYDECTWRDKFMCPDPFAENDD